MSEEKPRPPEELVAAMQSALENNPSPTAIEVLEAAEHLLDQVLRTDCFRGRSALPQRALRADAVFPRSCCRGEMLPDHLGCLGYHGCHALRVGDSCLRHVRLAAAFTPGGRGELAQNRVGSHATVAQIVTHHCEHCVLAVIK